MNEGILSFLVILAYLFILMGVALYCYKSEKIKNVESFFLANRGVSSVLLPLTMIAAMQSTFAFLGAPGMYYTHGIGFIVIVLSQAWVALMVIHFGHRIWQLGKKYGYLTIGDFFKDRYDSNFLKVFASAVSILMTVVFLAMQYVGSARAISGVSGEQISYLFALVVIAVFSLIYVITGGAKSVVLTDAIQAIILLSGIVIAAYIAIVPVGGISALFSKIAETAPELLSRPGPKGLYNDKNWVMQFILLPFGIWLCPHVWVRSLMAKDEKAISTSAMAVPISQIVIFATSGLFIGLSGHLLLQNLEVPDNVVPVLMNQYTNWFVASLVMAASIAAGMSTINSMILVCSQMFTQDIIIPFMRRKLREEENLLISRIVTLVIVVLGTLIAYKPPALLVSVVIDVAYTGLAQMAPAFILGLYWKRCNRTGATFGMVAGIVILFLTRIFRINPLGYPGFLWAILVNLVLTVGLSLMTEKPSIEKVDKIIGYFEGAR